MRKAPIRKVEVNVRPLGERLHELAVIIFIAVVILFLMVKIVFD
jgi:hypothetical protein